jgi:SAM-dependent methyltransferase
MRTRSEQNNPGGCDRYGFAWQHVPAGGAAHLDFGCGDGRFLRTLKSKNIKRLVGVDVSREAAGCAAASGDFEIIHVEKAIPLPFADRTFSSITLMDVLEHVDDQEPLLRELHRIVQDNGMLIVTVPGRHLFSFLDMGNLKFRFPRLHRWYYCRKHSRARYERRYVANPDGLIGDVSARKRWHEHFSRDRLQMLLNYNGWAVAKFDGAGLFVRVLKIAELLLGRIRPLRAGIKKLVAWDARAFASANLFCIARKCASLPLRDEKDESYDYDQAGHDLQAAGPQHVL